MGLKVKTKIANYIPNSLITSNNSCLSKKKIKLIVQVLQDEKPMSALDFDFEKFNQECENDKEFKDDYGWFSLTKESLIKLVTDWTASEAEQGDQYNEEWYIPEYFIKYLDLKVFLSVYAFLCKCSYGIKDFNKKSFISNRHNCYKILEEYVDKNNKHKNYRLYNFLKKEIEYNHVYDEFQSVIIDQIEDDSIDGNLKIILCISDSIKFAKSLELKIDYIKDYTSRFLEMEEDYRINENLFNAEIQFLANDVGLPEEEIKEIVNNFKSFFKEWYSDHFYKKYID